MANLQTVDTKEVVPDRSMAGLRILAVDDDITVLESIEQMCNRCHYHVTRCSKHAAALQLVRDRKGCFDVMLIDVRMAEMIGYEFLLQFFSHQMNLPVILMSVDASTSAFMKAIEHGACDYWIKPLYEEQFRNISLPVNDDATEGVIKEESHSKEAATKKPRLAWMPELHNKFYNAVKQIGLDKATPKLILEEMKVPGITRRQVSNHLQKYRNFLKSLKGETQQQNEKPKAGTDGALAGNHAEHAMVCDHPQVSNIASTDDDNNTTKEVPNSVNSPEEDHPVSQQ